MSAEDLRREPKAYLPVPAAWNELSRRVIACAMEVHTVLGPGLAERLYEDALEYELNSARIPLQRQRSIRLRYKDRYLSEQVIDLQIADLLILELKAVDRVSDVHLAQLVSYMRSADVPLGLLINFNVARLKDGLYRRINPNSSAIRASDHTLSPSVPSGSSEFSS